MKRSPVPATARRSTAASRSAQAAARTRPAPATTTPAHPADNGADELDTVFASVARYFSLLADATRLKILHTICQSEQSVSAIVQATGASQTNVSRHLALLHQAAVVGRRKEGNAVYYQVADPSSSASAARCACRSRGASMPGSPCARSCSSSRGVRDEPMREPPAGAGIGSRATRNRAAPGRILPAPAAQTAPRREFLRRVAALSTGAVAVGSGRVLAQDTDAALPPNVAAVEQDARRADPRASLRRSVAVRGERPPPRESRAHPHRAFVGRVHAAAEPLRRSSRLPACTSSATTPACRKIDPHQHRLMVHGMVREPRVFTMDDVMRFPSVSRVHFIECGANTRHGVEQRRGARPCSTRHGMLGCSEWTGVLLSTMLDELGVDRKAAYVLAEGADGASLTRTIPIAHGAGRRACSRTARTARCSVPSRATRCGSSCRGCRACPA